MLAWPKLAVVPCCLVWLFAPPWTVNHQAPLSVEFSRQEYWSGLPFPPPGDAPRPGIELTSRVSCIVRQILYHCTTWKDCQSLLAIKAVTSWCCLFDNRTLIFHWRCTVSNLARSPDIAICQDNLTSTDLKVDHLELAPGHLNTRAEDSWGCSILMVTPWKDHLCVHWFLLPGSAQFPWFLLFPRPILQLCLPLTELQLI